MPITCTTENRAMVARLIGEIDHHGAKAMMLELQRQIDRELPARLTLDCSGITFMDSSGIALLLRAWQRMGELGGKCTAVGIPPQPAKVLRAAGLDRLMKFN